ncbi:von Willebrand factor type A (vWA) domain protein containing protein [Candidatus Magnetoovum chiemensis]|nr:von Willebrand factor type A (vWA) domain protein containing protein [Candidatus Magnetoovum chiemensis]
MEGTYMKNNKKHSSLLLTLFALLAAILNLSANSYADDNASETADETLSPYFFVQSDKPEIDEFSLKSTTVEAEIAAVIADVTVTQVYENNGRRPIEAIYVFPASTKAAVYAMRMTIGERTIAAQIAEREKARTQYEQAKEEGKTASLLEQSRPNVFQMNVANILPGDVIKVEMRYTELLVPTDGVYDFTYPTVVGPRYTNQKTSEAAPSEKWTKNPYLHEGQTAPNTLAINVNLSTAVPIQEVTCPSHKVNIAYDGQSSAKITLNDTEKYGGNRDFIVKYRLSGGKIDAGLMLYEGDEEEEKFFLLMAQPPKSITVDEIPPREYVFIVDVSGSMRGFPLDISKRLLKDLIGNLRPSDMFNVLLFSGGSSVMAEKSLPATAQNIQNAVNLIENQRGGGGTELLPALKKTLELPRAEGFSTSIVIVTDGYVAVEKEAFDLIRSSLGKANMFAFGIGSSVNRFIIEGMARTGFGEPIIITKPEEAEVKANKFRKLIASPALTKIKLDYNSFNANNVEPPAIPDMLSDRPVIAFGKYSGNPDGTITISGITGKDSYKETIDVKTVTPSQSNKALKYLWARKRIELLGDYNKLSPDDERVKEITALGLKYSLLTDYTSFVAIDSQIRVKGEKAVTVKQPLPLPQGVSDLAVGYGAMAAMKSFSKGITNTNAVPRLPSSAQLQEKEETKTSKEPKSKQDAQNKPQYKLIIVKVEAYEFDITKTDIAAVFKRSLEDLNECYAGLDGSNISSNEATFSFLIDIEGNIKDLKITDGDFKNQTFAECLKNKLSKIKLSKPYTGKETYSALVLKSEKAKE